MSKRSSGQNTPGVQTGEKISRDATMWPQSEHGLRKQKQCLRKSIEIAQFDCQRSQAKKPSKTEAPDLEAAVGKVIARRQMSKETANAK